MLLIPQSVLLIITVLHLHMTCIFAVDTAWSQDTNLDIVSGTPATATPQGKPKASCGPLEDNNATYLILSWARILSTAVAAACVVHSRNGSDGYRRMAVGSRGGKPWRDDIDGYVSE